MHFPRPLIAVAVAVLSPALASAQSDLRQRASDTMHRATEFYHSQVASHGGYVYHYSLDLTQRWGEGVATGNQIWVQPPGTPTVGLASLQAYEATGDRFYLDAATDAALALVYGQLKSGGWTNCDRLRSQEQVRRRLSKQSRAWQEQLVVRRWSNPIRDSADGESRQSTGIQEPVNSPSRPACARCLAASPISKWRLPSGLDRAVEEQPACSKPAIPTTTGEPRVAARTTGTCIRSMTT